MSNPPGLAPGIRLGVYDVLVQLGAGGMGEVYRARDTRLKRDVAIKVLLPEVANDPERLARFQREAEVLATLNHPNIAHIYGLEGRESREGLEGLESRDGREGLLGLFLVLELVEGPTLADRIAASNGRGMPLDEALPIARQIAEALEAAHEQGIIHRDLKPANIKVRDDGTVKVLDFGLAKAIERAGGAGQAGRAGGSRASDRPGSPDHPGLAALTQSPTITSPALMTGVGVLLGTAAYMSPEQARGRTADARADIWAYGCVLYEMITGTKAFAGDDITDVLAAIVRDEPDWSRLPADLPKRLRMLLERCLRKEPRQRLQSIGDARIELEDARGTSASDVARPPALVGGSVSRRILVRIVIAAALAGVALGAAGLRFAASRRDAASPQRVQPLRRLELNLPKGLELRGITWPTLSPAADQVAFTAQDEDGVGIWVRRLDSGATRKIWSSGLLVRPIGLAWSPDGKHVAIPVNGRLIEVDASSGGARTICELPRSDRSQVAWGIGGVIVLTGGGNLYRVNTSEAVAQPIQILTAGDDSFEYPQFLADGRHVVVSVLGRSPETSGARVIDLDAPDQTSPLLLAGERGVKPVGAGLVAFVRNQEVYALALDGASGMPAGQPRPLGVNALMQVGTSIPVLSAADDVVIFRTPPLDEERHLVWRDRTGQSKGELAVPPNSQSIELSRTGSGVAFETFDRNTSSREVWTVQTSGTPAVRRTFDPADDADPLWSTHGDAIIFNHTSATASRQVFILPLASAGMPTAFLPAAVAAVGTHAISPDGKFLLGMRAAGTIAVPTDGSGSEIPLASQVIKPQFSPNGRFMAYELSEGDRLEAFVQPFPPTGAKWQISRDGGRMARWNPNGRELYYLTENDTLMAVTVSTDAEFTFGAPSALFKTRIAAPIFTAYRHNYAVAPDGRLLIVEPIATDRLDTLGVLIGSGATTR